MSFVCELILISATRSSTSYNSCCLRYCPGEKKFTEPGAGAPVSNGKRRGFRSGLCLFSVNFVSARAVTLREKSGGAIVGTERTKKRVAKRAGVTKPSACLLVR